MQSRRSALPPGRPSIAAPRSQLLERAPLQQVRRRMPPPWRFSLRLSDRIGQDLTVIGHLGGGRYAELYQVWSDRYCCALTCKIRRTAVEPGSEGAHAFRREIKVLKRLRHPQIVRLFEEGTWDGREFVVQEFLHGPSIFELLESSPQRRLRTVDALRTSIHIAGALHYLHGRGYLYRDIKPANIVLRGGLPVLVDFDAVYRPRGTARPRDRAGTDPYMAPEQCAGSRIGPESDVYGLGALLYEMLTGRWPLEDEMEQEERYPQLRHRPPPLRRFNPDVAEGLEGIVMRSLAMDPEERPRSALALVRDLSRELDERSLPWHPSARP